MRVTQYIDRDPTHKIEKSASIGCRQPGAVATCKDDWVAPIVGHQDSINAFVEFGDSVGWDCCVGVIHGVSLRIVVPPPWPGMSALISVCSAAPSTITLRSQTSIPRNAA